MHIMNHNFIRRLEFTQQLLRVRKEEAFAEYIGSQKETLIRISKGNPYILCTYYIPSEFTALFQIECLYLERIVGLAVGTHILKNTDEADRIKIGCSYHQTLIELIKRNIIQLPEHILCFEYPCRNCVEACTYLHEYYQIPIEYIKLDHLKTQLISLYNRMKDMYGVRQQIQDTVELSNTAAEIKRKIDSLRMNYPGLVSSDTALKIFAVENDFGTKTAVAVLSGIYNNMKSKIAVYQENNRKRIFWMGLIPLNNNNILSSIEKKLPVTFVYEEMWMFGDTCISEEYFFDEIAIKIENGLFYDNQKRIQKILTAIHDTKAAVVINLTQKGCSFLPPLLADVRAEVQKEGLPFINITTDVILDKYEDARLEEIIRQFI